MLSLLRRRSVVVGVSLVAWLALFFAPAVARAQQASSGIAGLVRDSSGAVLPGVTVEAASPALIEKVRSVVTDEQGRYSIVNLPIGAYAVTFSLTGFNTVKREGIQISVGFTATANADLPVGALEETITVTGASPLVDVQSTRQQTIVSKEQLESLPVYRGLSGIVAFNPGVVSTIDVGGTKGIHNSLIVGSVHGKTQSQKNYFDGMRISCTVGVGNNCYMVNTLGVEEVSTETGAFSAESAGGSVSTNSVPKEGGNTFRSEFSGMFTNSHLQTNNLSDQLRARGLTTVDRAERMYDGGATLGGPIVNDKLWFFTAHRWLGNKNQMAGLFWNATQGTPFYTPDSSRPATRYEYMRTNSVRLTWLASPRNKINVFLDNQKRCACRRNGFLAPEAQATWNFDTEGFYSVGWSAPVTSKLLFEASAAAVPANWPNRRQPGVTLTDIGITDSASGLVYNANPGPYRGGLDNINAADRYIERAAVSYVTGSHSVKVGFQVDQGVSDVSYGLEKPGGDIAYTFRGVAPTALSLWATPYIIHDRIKADLGAYVQDRWVVSRFTVNLGLRFDYFNAYVPAQHADAGPFVPVRDFAAVPCLPCWKDWDPRVGVSYDVFGNGKTAVKAYLGRVVGNTGIDVADANNPIASSVNTVSRAWTDTNGNYVPDCNLTNPAKNGECGAVTNANFGKVNPAVSRWDPNLLKGTGVRDYFWDLSTEVQHELGRGISVTAGYYRNWWGNLRVTDNLAVTPADYKSYCVTAPTDARLPGGGGYQVCGLADLNPTLFGQIANFTTRASGYGKQTQVSNFYSLTTNARLGGGLRFGGGLDWGATTTDNCFVVDSPQQLLNCHVHTPLTAQTQLKLFGSYPLSGGFSVSGVFQNRPSTTYTANYAAALAEVLPSLGRPLSGSATTVTAPLLPPQTYFEARFSQLDLRVSKMFRVGSRRLAANFDMFNALNSSAILDVNSTFGPKWRQPSGGSSGNAHSSSTGTIDGRLIELSGTLSF